MAKYQNLLVAIDPNQDDQPALRRAVYLVKRNGGRIKAFLPIYDFLRNDDPALSGRKNVDAARCDQPTRRLDQRAVPFLSQRRRADRNQSGLA